MLEDVQGRFEVSVPEMPKTLDKNTYSESDVFFVGPGFELFPSASPAQCPPRSLIPCHPHPFVVESQ